MGQLISLIQQYGLGFVFLNVLALQAGVPIPAYPTLIVAGAYAATMGPPVYALVAIGVLAAVIADTGWYLAGRRFGTRVLKTLCRVSLSPDSCVRQTESIFTRFGPSAPRWSHTEAEPGPPLKENMSGRFAGLVAPSSV